MESGKRQSSGKVKGSGQGNDRGSTPIDVSTDEATIKSHLPSADFDAIENHSYDLHLYTHKFEAFAAMVEQLKGKGCLLVQAAIRKLLASVGYYSKSLRTMATQSDCHSKYSAKYPAPKSVVETGAKTDKSLVTKSRNHAARHFSAAAQRELSTVRRTQNSSMKMKQSTGLLESSPFFLSAGIGETLPRLQK